jgi:hypothetical protein
MHIRILIISPAPAIIELNLTIKQNRHVIYCVSEDWTNTLNRRRLLQTAVGTTAAVTSTHLTGISSAQGGIEVTGTIESESPADLSKTQVDIFRAETGWAENTRPRKNGQFSLTVPERGEYELAISKRQPDPPELPILYSFGSKTITGDGELATLSIPESYQTTIRCLDPEGNPIKNLPINFRTLWGMGLSPGLFTTTKEGVVVFTGTNIGGVELRGGVQIEIQNPPDGTSVPLRSVTITERSTIELTVENPSEYTTTSNILMIDADPEAGFNFPYFLALPPQDAYDSGVPLAVIPNNTGTATDNTATHQHAAYQTAKFGMAKNFVERLGLPALVPTFPRPLTGRIDWKYYTHQLDDDTLGISEGPLERIDLQLLSMIDHARDQLSEDGYPVTDEGVVLDGYSASGNFANRFTVLHPNHILGVTAGGLNGMAILPVKKVDDKELPYHIGIGNVEDLIGKEPDIEALKNTPQFYYHGAESTNDTLESVGGAFSHKDHFELAYEIYGEDMAEDRWETSRAMYEEAGINSAEFRLYENIGHEITSQTLNDVFDFHAEIVSQYRDQDQNDEKTTTDQTPGFGLGSGLTAIGAVGYILQRRFKETTE